MKIGVIAILLLSTCLAAFGQLFLKKSVAGVGLSITQISTFVDLALSPLFLIGMSFYGISLVLWLLALSKADLSYVFPFTALTLTLVLVASWAILGEKFPVNRLIGVLLVLIGLAVSSVGGR
ncbi:MAG: hypothetical protein ISR58_05815 [Anaerolineales bacterium]|nr:hypothetical protein [Chloroflexota bacterium]MBL6980692.1 hypothetical protein [Anaerolineales bacterium]